MTVPFNIFLSWSGDRSRRMATLLHEWLPRLLPTARTFISHSIDKGRDGVLAIRETLLSEPICVACITTESRDAPWLLFEAGALAIRRERIYTIVLDDKVHPIPDPLGSYQYTRISKEDFRLLLRSLNRMLALSGESLLEDSTIDFHLETHWQSIEGGFRSIPPSGQIEDSPISPASAHDAILDVILDEIRRVRSVLGTREENLTPRRALPEVVFRVVDESTLEVDLPQSVVGALTDRCLALGIGIQLNSQGSRAVGRIDIRRVEQSELGSLFLSTKHYGTSRPPMAFSRDETTGHLTVHARPSEVAG